MTTTAPQARRTPCYLDVADKVWPATRSMGCEIPLVVLEPRAA